MGIHSSMGATCCGNLRKPGAALRHFHFADAWFLGEALSTEFSTGSLALVGARRFEPSATGLSLFVVAFCVLTLLARCLYRHAFVYLKPLALLHRCYRERLWFMRVSGALLW